MAVLCWWNENIVYHACCTGERWLLVFAYWFETLLMNLWSDLYEGSDEEIEDALNGGVPFHHMTKRQQTAYIGAMAEGGLS